jgi:hypothetical protein
MKLARTTYLIAAVALLSATAVAFLELRLRGHLSFEAGRAAAYVVFLLHAAVVVLGLWSAHRVAWAAYLVVSVAAMVLLGASTPFSALWVLAWPIPLLSAPLWP